MKKTLILFFAVFCCVFSSCDDNKPPVVEEQTTIYVRKNAHTVAAQEDLKAYATAIDAMKKLPCTDPRSWYFQGAMHNIPPRTQMGGKIDTLCPCYGDTCGALASWANCPHMKPDAQQLHFLVWHRLYTWYFERVVRKFSGKKDFAMPYWNYFTESQRTLPENFIRPDGNPLYEIGRSRVLMSGQAIGSSDSDGIVVNSNGIIKLVATLPMNIILDTTRLWSLNSYAQFSAQTESVPHNCMHDYIGGAVNKKYDLSSPIYNRIYQLLDSSMGTQGLMAMVPSAGFDPIFFLHHANLDRFWMGWEKAHPQSALTFEEFNTAGMWTYNFIDENGKTVTYTSLKQIFDSIRSINYTYDYMVGQNQKEAAPVKHAQWNRGAELATKKPMMQMLKTEKKSEQYVIDFPQQLKAAQEGNTYYSLEVEVSVAKPTHSFLAVVLDVNDTVEMKNDEKKFVVGVVGFFGMHKHEAGAAHGLTSDPSDGRLHKTFTFDISKQLELQNGFNSKGVTVHVTPLRPEPNNPIQVHNVKLREYNKN